MGKSFLDMSLSCARFNAQLHQLVDRTKWAFCVSLDGRVKGFPLIREYNGDTYEAEIHWFEAHGIGRRNWKIKKRLR